MLMVSRVSFDMIRCMVKREAYTSVAGGRSILGINVERRIQNRELKNRWEAERREAVTDFLLKLNEANSSVSLSTALEVVYPVTILGRVISPHKDRIIPAEISHISGKSTLGGWLNYRKITGRYLIIEEAAGYVTASDEPFPDKAILQNGRVGALLKPCRDGSQTYTYGGTSIHLDDWDNSFEKRNCQAIWGPSLVNPEELGFYEAGKATHNLGI